MHEITVLGEKYTIEVLPEEEMVDWLAIQFPKILKAFEEANCI